MKIKHIWVNLGKNRSNEIAEVGFLEYKKLEAKALELLEGSLFEAWAPSLCNRLYMISKGGLSLPSEGEKKKLEKLLSLTKALDIALDNGALKLYNHLGTAEVPSASKQALIEAVKAELSREYIREGLDLITPTQEEAREALEALEPEQLKSFILKHTIIFSPAEVDHWIGNQTFADLNPEPQWVIRDFQADNKRHSEITLEQVRRKKAELSELMKELKHSGATPQHLETLCGVTEFFDTWQIIKLSEPTAKLTNKELKRIYSCLDLFGLIAPIVKTTWEKKDKPKNGASPETQYIKAKIKEAGKYELSYLMGK